MEDKQCECLHFLTASLVLVIFRFFSSYDRGHDYNQQGETARTVRVRYFAVR